MHQSGIEPPHTAPEAVALSTELLVHDLYIIQYFPEIIKWFLVFLNSFGMSLQNQFWNGRILSI